jgi:WD40 repeat protein
MRRLLLLLVLVLVTAALAAPGQPQGVDANGDPLPKGALARLGSTRWRHETGISAQAASPDGKWLATGGGRSVRISDAATGKQAYLFPLNTGTRSGAPTVLAFSADSAFLAALGTSAQGVVTVWDVKQGQQRYQFAVPMRDDNVGGGVRFGQAEEAPLLTFASKNSGVLVRNPGDRVVRLFDLESSQEVRTFQDPGNQLSAVAASRDGTLLAGGSESKQVLLWEVATGKELRRLPHDYNLVSIAFNPDGRTLATLDQDLSPILWEVQTGKQLFTLPARTRSIGLAFSHDGKSLHVGRQPDEIVTWNLQTKQEQKRRLPKNWMLTTSSWLTTPATAGASGSDRIVLGSLGRRAAVARMRMVELGGDDAKPPAFDGYESNAVYPFYLSAVKQWASIGMTGDDAVRLWDETGRVAAAFPLPITDPNLSNFAVAPDGRRFCLGSRDGSLYFIDASTRKLVRRLQAFQKVCFDSSFTADGKAIVAHDLRTAKVFDVESGKELKSFDLHSFDCMRAVFSADGTRIAALVYQQDEEQPTLKIFDARSGALLSEMRSYITQNMFWLSADGRMITFIGNNRGNRSGHVQVVEVASGKLRMQADVPNPYQYVGNHARISPDGRWLATVANGVEAEQHAIIAWKLGQAEDPIVFSGHRGPVAFVNFGAGSKQMLSLSNDTTMLTWDLQRFAKPDTAPRRGEKELLELWTELKNTDPIKAFAAVHQLAGQPDAVPWLTQQLFKQVVMPDPEQVRDLVEKLDAPKFSDREKAEQELTRWGNAVAHVLRDALAGDISAEVRKRLQKILEKSHETGGLGGLSLQAIRGIEALEIMGNPAALNALDQIARRTDPLGAEARGAALRLKQRMGS